MTVGKLQVLGKQDKSDKHFPELVATNCTENESLVEILYETKPLNYSCDQRVHVKARPLRIIYHADTINKVRDIFNTGDPEEMSK